MIIENQMIDQEKNKYFYRTFSVEFLSGLGKAPTFEDLDNELIVELSLFDLKKP